MDEKDFQKAIGFCRELGKKRKFEQSVEMAVNFKGIDFKKADNRVELDVKLPHVTGKQGNIQVLVFVKDKSFGSDIKNKVAKIIFDSDIPNLKKKDIDNLMKEYSLFLAEGTTMLTVGKYLGQQLAPKGRMPKPVQNNVQALNQALKGASTFTKITNKKGKFMPVIHTMVGKENFKDEDLIENIMAIYKPLVSSLANKEGNIKSVFIKFTMGRSIKVGEDYSKVEPSEPKEKTKVAMK